MDRKQDILNSRPEYVSKDGWHALEPEVPITARIVWEHGGQEFITTTAIGWLDRHVYVRMPRSDLRWAAAGVWLPAQDVKRRSDVS